MLTDLQPHHTAFRAFTQQHWNIRRSPRRFICTHLQENTACASNGVCSSHVTIICLKYVLNVGCCVNGQVTTAGECWVWIGISELASIAEVNLHGSYAFLAGNYVNINGPHVVYVSMYTA
jgi:hypothetical protein